jgi:hypothetical protein
MKSLSRFKQAPTVILEEEKSDYSKFDMLVRAGLANKAQMQRIHKILDKMQEERPQFNNTDKAILQNLFNKMVDVITNNKQIFQQTKRVVREELEEGVIDTTDFKVGPSGRKIRAHRVVVSKNTEIEDQEDQKIKEHTEIIEEQFRGDPPNVLLLKRKAIRMYPNSTRIALYYNDRLNKYFSIPYSTEENISAPIQAEEVKLDEAVHGVEQLRKIVNSKQHGVVNHRDGSASKIDHHTASAILAVHDNLNDENKKKINNMVSASKYHIQKVANFAYSKTK